MRRTLSDSWCVTTDMPLELQLWGYIGHHAGFRLDAERPAQSPDELAWRRWWDIFLTNAFGQIAAAVERSMPGAVPTAHLQQAAARSRTIFDPPDFNTLTGDPTLQALCRQQWPAFHSFWSVVGGEQARMSEQLKAQLRRVDFNHLVRECLQTTGKRGSRPFRLHIDVVYWPEAYQRHIADDHVVLGGRYLAADQAEAFTQIVRSSMCRLV